MIEVKSLMIEIIEQQFSEIIYHINNLQSQILGVERLLLYVTYGKDYKFKDLQELGQLLYVQNQDDQILIKITKEVQQSKEKCKNQLNMCLKNLLEHIKSQFQQNSSIQVSPGRLSQSQNFDSTSDKQNKSISSGNLKQVDQNDKKKVNKIQKPLSDDLQLLETYNLNGQENCSSVLPNYEIIIGKKQGQKNKYSTIESIKFSGQQNTERKDLNKNQNEGVTSLFYNEQLKHILAGYQDGRIKLYYTEPKWKKKMFVWEYSGKIQSLQSFHNHKDQNEFIILSCGQNTQFKCFKIKNLRCEDLFFTKLEYQIVDLLMLDDNKETAILTERELVIYQLNTWKAIQNIELETSLCGNIIQNKIIIGQQSGILQIFGKKEPNLNYEIFQSLKLTNQILQVQYSIQSNYLFIREINKVSIFEFNPETYQCQIKQIIDGNYSHILIIQSQEFQAIGLCLKEPQQIIVLKDSIYLAQYKLYLIIFQQFPSFQILIQNL